MGPQPNPMTTKAATGSAPETGINSSAMPQSKMPAPMQIIFLSPSLSEMKPLKKRLAVRPM